MNTNKIKVIAFDADDTLWDNQSLFDATESRYCEILSPYGTEQEIRKALLKVEIANMPNMGYGTKAFILSLIQNALEVSNNTIPATSLNEILRTGMNILNNPATPFPRVEETLKTLKERGKYKLVCFTKGELLDQENKCNRSGLRKYFDHLEITSDKSKQDYLNLCDKMGVKPDEFLMVGNSFKSDIHPIIELGGYGIHIPYKRMWQYEHLEEYEHERVERIDKFEDSLNIIA